jgi:hypothetical protein
MPEGTVVDRPEVEVLYLSVEDNVAAMQKGWATLEAAVGSLRGRRFYGAFYPSTKEYRVCVEPREDDDAVALGLERGSLEGGRYLRVRLKGEPPGVYSEIGSTFAELARRSDAHQSRPSIEFYRRYDEIDLLLPVS